MREILDDTIASWDQERPDLDLQAMATVLRLGQVTAATLRMIDAVFGPLGINLGEFDVLAALRRKGEDAVLTPTVLARVAMVTPGGMTNRLNRLEAAGLIDRRPDPDDRRGWLVTLTPAGRAIADQAVADLAAAETELLGALSATERRRLDQTLDKLIDRFDAAHDAVDGEPQVGA